MSTPKSVIDTIAALKAERGPLTARLDAIDLAIDNLSRVYGLHGTPQPLPTHKPKAAKLKRVVASPVKEVTAAADRRDALLSIIAKQEFGATIADLRKHAPRIDGKERSNALNILKTLGKIKRVGNTWKAA